MKRFSLVFSIVRLALVACSVMLSPVAAAVSVIAPAIMYAVRSAPADLHALWQALRLLPAVAFRLISRLKPVYRESYATNGHSLGIACLT